MTYLINQIGHLTLQTPELDKSLKDAQNILGMRVVSVSENRATLTSNTRRGEITYVLGSEPALIAVGVEAKDAAAVFRARERAEKFGVKIVSSTPTAPGASDSFTFICASGVPFEVHSPVPRDQPAEYFTPGVRPRRLDHVNLLVLDPIKTSYALEIICGLKLSDKTDDDGFMFLRGGDLFHHMIALVRGQPGIHHYSFEARDISDLCRVGDHLHQLGRPLVWGPGHHGANAQSYFTYHRDSDGCFVEYSFGMTRIDDDLGYRPQVWPANPEPGEEWLNLWGAPPPAMFANPSIPISKSYEVGEAA
jgi:catechol 2,3-dioxygenase